jgi:hypothetical protein
VSTLAGASIVYEHRGDATELKRICKLELQAYS